MKSILAIASSVLGLVVLLLVLNVCYWHLFGLHFRQYSAALPGALFWLGVLLTVFATGLAAWDVRRCWQSRRFPRLFAWCCTLCLGYLGLLLYAAGHTLQ